MGVAALPLFLAEARVLEQLTEVGSTVGCAEEQLQEMRAECLRGRPGAVGGSEPARLAGQFAAPLRIGELPEFRQPPGYLGQPVPLGEIGVPARTVEDRRADGRGVGW